MEQKYYVVQYKLMQSDPWATLAGKHETAQEAKADMDDIKASNPYCFAWRVAEAYTQVRYKAVKL